MLKFSSCTTAEKYFSLKLLKMIFFKKPKRLKCVRCGKAPLTIIYEALRSGGIEGSQCSGLHYIPPKDTLKSKPLVLVHEILFANKVFADVIKLRWGHTKLGWASIQRLVSFGHRNRGREKNYPWGQRQRWDWYSCQPRTPRIVGSHLEARKRQRRSLP